MRELQCGVLVVGGGAAGTRAAYEAKRAHPELEVCLAVTGRYETGGSTNMVASEALGINAPFNCEGDGDDPEIYLEDTLQTGGGLGDSALCWVLAHEAADRVRELAGAWRSFRAQGRASGAAKALRVHQGPLFDLRRQHRASDYPLPQAGRAGTGRSPVGAGVHTGALPGGKRPCLRRLGSG